MKRSILQLTALALVLTLVGGANAKGNSGSKGSSGSQSFKISSYKMSSSGSCKSYCKPYGKCFYNGSFYCSHKCYCDCYGCYCYWYPTNNCWCLWYQPWGCYIPWSTYVTLVTPVAAQPIVGQTAVAQAPAPPAPPAQ
jgi:hypothetical protein